MASFEETSLWRIVSERASDEQRAMTSSALAGAADLLDRIVETFPTYTLHNRTHAENVVALMEKLLGPTVDQLSALEAAMLLLSAYFHDAGMAYTEDERAALRHDEAFGRFLDTHPEAFLELDQAGDEVPRGVAEWFCRWHHAERVYDVIDGFLADRIAWGAIPLRDALAEVCRSHNRPAASLYEQAFALRFAGDCDLRFCALLLRLADVLDFDRSRSPETVYRYLGLQRRESAREQASDVEWLKHLAVEGFRFPEQRTPAYSLDFVAGPDDPTVEHDVRQFLDVIEGELRECASVVATCSGKWRDLPLPGKITRENIHSKGYKFGEHRFTLDRDQVLELFMGERLYDDPAAFVRELLQNAIDTSRHREFFEHSQGRRDYAAAPIQIRQWVDRDRHRWLSVEDFGLGMTEEIILSHFLKVGSSYYRSAAFRADVLRYARDGRQFLPISRFGIGILSCFVLADRIEVSTRAAALPGEHAPQPIRLSISDLEGFFTLQVKPMPAAPMPTPDGAGDGYRTDAGTLVAVRIDPRKEAGTLDLAAAASGAVLASPVPVEFEGEPVGGERAALMDEPLRDYSVTAIDAAIVSQLEELFECSLPNGLQLHVVPLDLTAHSPDPDLRGQLLLAYVTGGPALEQALRGHVRTARHSTLEDVRMYDARSLYVDLTDNAVTLRSSRSQRVDDVEGRLETARHHAQSLVDAGKMVDDETRAYVETLETWFHRPERRVERNVLDALIPPAKAAYADEHETLAWSHNGIVVPRNLDVGYGGSVELTAPEAPEDTDSVLVGFLALTDGLRPDVSVSRDRLRSLPWRVHLIANLAVRQAAATYASLEAVRWSSLLDMRFDARTPLEAVDDALLHDPHGWPSIGIIDTKEGLLSIEDVRAGAAPVELLDGLPSEFVLYGGTSRLDFTDLCQAALLALHLTVTLVFDPAEQARRYVAHAERSRPLGLGLRLFPPLFFVSYEGSDLLQVGVHALNIDHPFSRWLIGNAEQLHAKQPGAFAALLAELRAGHPVYGARDTAEITAILARLADIHPELAPPSGVVPTSADFEHHEL
jgi:hypothetical protein